jgi:hypothetical protein
MRQSQQARCDCMVQLLYGAVTTRGSEPAVGLASLQVSEKIQIDSDLFTSMYCYF